MNQQNAEIYPAIPLDEARIDPFGHIIRTACIPEGDEDYNPEIEVFREPERGQIYQMWAVMQLTDNDIISQAFKEFKLAGPSVEKEQWTQLLEHLTGVAAIAVHIGSLLEKYGAAVAGIDQLKTAALVHDLEKPAEIAASGGGGLENSRDNPVLREGHSWQWLHEHGVSDDIILAAQNTGRSDRFFSDLSDYNDNAVKKALQDREILAQSLQVDRSVVDAMTPQQRRRASIEVKGLKPAIVGFSDYSAEQFKFCGATDEKIDARAARYAMRKNDPESVTFFSHDCPEYYKEVVRYLIDQVPEANRAAFTQELYALTPEKIFNQTVLPAVLGTHALMVAAKLRAAGKPNSVDTFSYVL